jgi:hypothetical protein
MTDYKPPLGLKPRWLADEHRLDVALWRDLPIRLDKGTTQRGNGNGGTTTPRPPIQP